MSAVSVCQRWWVWDQPELEMTCLAWSPFPQPPQKSFRLIFVTVIIRGRSVCFGLFLDFKFYCHIASDIYSGDAAFMWKWEENFGGLDLSYHMGSRDQTQVVRPCSRQLYPRRLSSPGWSWSCPLVSISRALGLQHAPYTHPAGITVCLAMPSHAYIFFILFRESFFWIKTWSWAWWFTPIIPDLGTLRQENCQKLKVNPYCREKPCFKGNKNGNVRSHLSCWAPKEGDGN